MKTSLTLFGRTKEQKQKVSIKPIAYIYIYISWKCGQVKVHFLMHSNHYRTALFLYLFCRNVSNKNHKSLHSIYDSRYDLMWNLHILSFSGGPLKNTDKEHVFKSLRAFTSIIPSIPHHNLTLSLSLFLFKPLSCVQPTLPWKPLCMAPYWSPDLSGNSKWYSYP